MQSLEKIVATLINYYDQAVVVEDDYLGSLNDELATLRLPSNEQSEMENFAANVSFKQKTIRTKLEERRVTKIQKLLHPEADKPGSSKDNRTPKRKNKRKQKKKQNNKQKIVKEENSWRIRIMVSPDVEAIRIEPSLNRNETLVPPIKKYGSTS